MPGLPEHFFSAFFVLGLLVVAAYAWKRFNEPSFPHQDTLPQVLEPLRYLFLRPAYRKAQFTYVVVSLLLYCLLVFPGPAVVPILGSLGFKEFPPEAWALVVALLLVGLVPNSNLRWLTMIEDGLRRFVHTWFFVPDAIERTVGVLEDAHYDPPASQLDAIQSPQKEKLQDDLKLRTASLYYRWARATMLLASLRQMGAGAPHPLKRAAFAPFEKDLEAIRAKYRILKQDIEGIGNDPSSEKEENLASSVNYLLKRIYAYISWGIRHQADTERDVDETLEELGFRIPKSDGRRLFDVVAPAVIFVALVTMVFWVSVDAVSRAMGAPVPTMAGSVVSALSSAMAASFMYGGAVFIGLKHRYFQIEQKIWRQNSAKCFAPIAFYAGLMAWLVIILTTALWTLPETAQSLIGLAQLVKGLAIDDAGTTSPEWSFLPIKIATALPWLLAGATVGVVVVHLLGGDVRRTDKRNRVYDAMILGVGLGAAAALAQLIQTSLAESAFAQKAPPYSLVPIVGLAGLTCGIILGYKVPKACRRNIVTPREPVTARDLADLRHHANATLATPAVADDWVFTPHDELGGITPAEAIQHKTHATGVRRLLAAEVRLERDTARRGRADKPHPLVIEGGRAS